MTIRVVYQASIEFIINYGIYMWGGSLLPKIGNNATFLQIYFMSELDQISIRTNMIPNLKRGLIELFQRILRENNHLIQSFRSNLESRSFDELQNFKLIIYADRVPQDEHRGQYNAPTIDEVAVLLVNEDKGPRYIVLQGAILALDIVRLMIDKDLFVELCLVGSPLFNNISEGFTNNFLSFFHG
ncbi:hypothetical protein QTP88_008620 [Uroleucon formosanum]